MSLLAAKSWFRLVAPLALAAVCVRVQAQSVEFPPDPKRWTNNLGMIFVPVPGTRVFFSIWETRMEDFAAFAASQPGLDGTNWNHALYHNATAATQGPDCPVLNVSWNDANAFCAWFTATDRKAERIPSGAGYRLPTDAEWSWAVGIGDRETNGTPKDKNGRIEGVFPWGTQYPPPDGAGNFADLTARDYFTNWPCIPGYRDGFVTAAPVGSFKPNALGLYDLAGNAAEWVADPYDGVSRRRELRGGAWVNTGPKSLWSSDRMAVAPERFSVITCFRCVLATNQ